MPRKRVKSLVGLYSECARKGKESGLTGLDLAKFVGDCLKARAEAKKELEIEYEK